VNRFLIETFSLKTPVFSLTQNDYYKFVFCKDVVVDTETKFNDALKAKFDGVALTGTALITGKGNMAPKKALLKGTRDKMKIAEHEILKTL